MGLPIYQMDVYQKTPPKVKHTDITQKSPNWFQQLENIKSLQKNPTKSKKNIKTLEQTLPALKSRSSNLPDGSVPKDLAKFKHTGIIQKSPIWSWQLENIKSLQKKTTKSKKKILKHLNKPCIIEKWVFQSRRLKRTKRPRPK